MNMELLFSITGILSMIGWLLLLVSPFIPEWSHKLAGRIIPALLSAGYIVLAVFFTPATDGGFGSLSEVLLLVSTEEAMLAFWIHVLAFDLVVGAWICHAAREAELNFWFVIPCLVLAFMFGPAGFLSFVGLRLVIRSRVPPAA